MPRNEQTPNYLPTPSEIAAECARIRGEWTPREQAKRRVDGASLGWSIPQYRFAFVGDRIGQGAA